MAKAKSKPKAKSPTKTKAAPPARKKPATETPRTRAPTVSTRSETPRTRAPTERPGTDGGAPPRRSRGETLVFDPSRSSRPRSDTQADPQPRGRARSETTIWRPKGSETAMDTLRNRNDTRRDEPHREVSLDDGDGTGGDTPSDPARALELATLEERGAQTDDPNMLVAIASQIDTLGMQLAFEISRHAHDEAHVAPLKPVLIRVPAAYGRVLVRAAEKFDDLGSPKRAAYVLFEALRKAFDAGVIASMADALAFTLEAHGQGAPATRLRELVGIREAQRAAGVERKEIRTQFADALAQLRDRGIDWNALADDPVQFD